MGYKIFYQYQRPHRSDGHKKLDRGSHNEYILEKGHEALVYLI